MPEIPSTEHLRQLRERLDALIDRAHDLVGPLTTEQLHWSPGKERWSIAQCLAHLVRTSELWQPRFERALERAELLGPSEAPFRSGFIGRWVLSMMNEASPRKLQAPPAFRPDERPEDDVFGDFLSSQERVRLWIERAEGKDLRRVKVASPFAAILRLRLGDALDLLVTHAERHVAQIRSLRGEREFPR